MSHGTELRDQASFMDRGECFGALEHIPTSGSQFERMRAPVIRRRLPPRQTASFEPVQQAHEACTLNPE
jgi:hypothetical protein